MIEFSMTSKPLTNRSNILPKSSDANELAAALLLNTKADPSARDAARQSQ
jgi:hypothetical protein